jgi:hypothetical protein
MTVILSPTLASMVGIGHLPLMPMHGRENPSGAQLTHPMSKLNNLSANADWHKAANAKRVILTIVKRVTK